MRFEHFSAFLSEPASYDVDMGLAPDASLALAVACLFAEGESRLRGLSTLRVKESSSTAAAPKPSVSSLPRCQRPVSESSRFPIGRMVADPPTAPVW